MNFDSFGFPAVLLKCFKYVRRILMMNDKRVKKGGSVNHNLRQRSQLIRDVISIHN